MNKKKKKILALAVALAISGGTQAQIFNMGSNGNDGINNRNGSTVGSTTELFGNIYIYESTDNNAEGFGNEYKSPLGSGLFLLAGMAGAYAVMRRKKDED